MARILGGTTPAAQQRRQEQIIDRAVLKYERRIAREIARAMRQAARNIREGRILPVESIRAEHERRIGIIMNSLWTVSANESAENLLGTQKSINLKIERKEDNEILKTVNPEKIARDWLRLYGGTKIKDITSTTIIDITRIVNGGIEDGLSEIEISKLIAQNSAIRGLARAQTIARTESHQAMSVAAMSTAKATGIKMRKQWVASKGDRTRQEHAEADMQIVAMDQPFNVGGESLAFPGDPAGSAWNVINCRCVVVFIL